MHTSADMLRADVYFLKTSGNPSGMLILCPGCNENGEEWIKDPIWQNFARSQNLDLAGISFSSDVTILISRGGYYCASLGSGKILLDAIKRVYGREMPMLLYGFSGGAHFVSDFANWHPKEVVAWCAYSAGWWDARVSETNRCPSLIICGQEDFRLGASLDFFEEGRELGKPWLWLSPSTIGHAHPIAVENFIRKYFASILVLPQVKNDGWLDLDTAKVCRYEDVLHRPTLYGWLPDVKLATDWRRIELR
jgi:hypothetical protein